MHTDDLDDHQSFSADLFLLAACGDTLDAGLFDGLSRIDAGVDRLAQDREFWKKRALAADAALARWLKAEKRHRGFYRAAAVIALALALAGWATVLVMMQGSTKATSIHHAGDSMDARRLPGARKRIGTVYEDGGWLTKYDADTAAPPPRPQTAPSRRR